MRAHDRALEPARESDPVTPDRVRYLRERLGGIAFGGDYNPEQWPASTRSEDLRLMTRAGVNLITLGVFGWARVEPEPDEYDFSFYDEVMDELATAGITVNLATMTASPPPWLPHRYPETLPVTAAGGRLSPGGRQHFCPSGPVYRDRAARLVERLARHYGDHPALGLWHVGNEYGCHVPECYCDVSAGDFRRWLRERYQDPAALNEAWSTDFWSQRYTSFDQVLPPRSAPTYPNPAQQLDFKRFSDQAMRECFRVEERILRAVTPTIPVTTNFLTLHKPVNLHGWARDVDLVAVDNYPDPADARPDVMAGLGYDSVRGARGGDPWQLMEQAPSAVNWRARNLVKRPGQMRLWSWQAVAHGADAVMYFQWRQSRGGAEKFHSGMVPHAGPDTRVFREVADLGRELAAVPDLAGTRVRNETALLLDWDSWWALELDSRPSDAVQQVDRLLDHYTALYDLGIGVDVVSPRADLSAYRLVVVPNLYLMSPGDGERLTGFVRSGGSLVVSFFSGIVDACDRVHLGGYPAPLREVLGVVVEEFQPAAAGETFPVRLDGGPAGGADLWREDLRLEGARTETEFLAPSGAPAGGPDATATTVHRFGAGTARYLATRLDPVTMRALMARVTAEAGVGPVLAGLPVGVRAARRSGAGRDFLILLNHTGDPHEIALDGERCDALSPGGDPVRSITLPAGGVAVLRSA